MQELVDTNCAPSGVDIPVPIVQEKLWELDVDDELWADLTWHGAFQDKDAPKWLIDQPTRQGIHAMLELECCMEELERLDHEQGVMYKWLQQQREQLHLAGGIAIAQGKSSDTLLLGSHFKQFQVTAHFSIRSSNERSSLLNSVICGA
jgi:hypothetical protein